MGSAIAGFILVFAGQAIQASGGVGQADTDAEQLTDRPDAFGSLLAGSIVALVGFVLLSVALSFLYSAAARRSNEMRTTFAPMLPLGAVLIGISGILSVFAFDSISSDFLGGMPTTGDAGETRAEDLISENSLFQAGGFVGIAGLFAFTVGIFYTGLHAMRTGLLTRFWATLGMALSVLMLLSQVFGPVGIVGVLVWTVAVSLQAAGRWPGGRPRAWEVGKAVPWPKPGEEAVAVRESDEEAALPEDFEGSATEVAPERPGRRDNKRKRKRKAR